MEVEELMALEEDLNDEEQQEDSKRLAIYLSSDLKEQHFTDVTIISKDQTYKIHKEYLLAFTNYDIPVIEGQPLREMPALNLCEVDGADVAAVLHFLYYGELKATIYNILGIMSAANALGLVDIPALLQEYHDKLFAAPNQTNIIDFAVCKCMNCVADYTWKIFVASFYDHVNGAHFLSWDVRWVMNLLCYDDVPIKTELEVFEAARLWLNYRPEERTDHVRQVLNCVRWTYMMAEEMVCCEREDPCLMNRPEAHELVADANWYKVMIQKGKSWSDFNIKPPRGAYANRAGIVVIPPRPAGCRPSNPAPGGGDNRVNSSAPPPSSGGGGHHRKAKDKDFCGTNKKKTTGDATEMGTGNYKEGRRERELRQQLEKLPIPPESDLFSKISSSSLVVDLSATCQEEINCTNDITRF